MTFTVSKFPLFLRTKISIDFKDVIKKHELKHEIEF
jgi:hypothetical protein